MDMFCYQCQETAGNKGCTRMGACGKTAVVSNKQDLLIWISKGLSEVLIRLRQEGIEPCRMPNELLVENLFTSITNVNFDEESIRERIKRSLLVKDRLIGRLKNKEGLSEAASWNKTDDRSLDLQAKLVGVLNTEDEDIRSLRELITYGLKGLAAYMSHASILGRIDTDLDKFIQEALAKTLDDSLGLEELLELTIETGKHGVTAMALLDEANTKSYGNPEITEVNIGVGKRPGILISGHDLKDMEMLLEQTEGMGIDIYSHSEMLPANYYPKFKKYDHFVGNYGNAWWLQDKEFETFRGPILMTTNCIVPPKASYKDRLYTSGLVSYPGCKHISADEQGHKDFSQLIEEAKKCQAPEEIERGSILGGFAHNQVLQLADKIVEAVNKGDIKKFVVMAGCDGRQKGRNYYTDFAKGLEKDRIILTAGCAKYRYNKLELGHINGIPRVLDAGQCNDSYSLALIAIKLQEILGLEDINDLPIIYNIAWYEQKAVIVLLALLALGVKNIHLGPSLPAFLSDGVLEILIDKFGISGISEVEEDLEKFSN